MRKDLNKRNYNSYGTIYVQVDFIEAQVTDRVKFLKSESKISCGQ
jgi:hypothetical protein